MIDNFFQDDYHSYDRVYTHPSTRNCIYIGDMQSALDDDFLCNCRIKLVVTAAKDMEHIVINQSIKHIALPLVDSKLENISTFFDSFYDIVEKYIGNGNLLVHCAAGISRSSTLVISYIMKKQNKGFKEVIALVRKGRPNVLPNLGFERQLKHYELALNIGGKESRVQRRGQVKTSQSSKRNYALKTEAFPQVGSRNLENKLSQMLSINYKRVTDKITPKDIKIFNIYNNNNRFRDARQQFKNRIKTRIFSHQVPDAPSKANYLPRQSVSQNVSRPLNVHRARIRTEAQPRDPLGSRLFEQKKRKKQWAL